jgi:hypothetical protein
MLSPLNSFCCIPSREQIDILRLVFHHGIKKKNEVYNMLTRTKFTEYI